jgi:large subunit ribosomal protein L18
MAVDKKARRERRKKHIRKNLYGTEVIPRVFVYKSNKYVYVGASDDIKGEVLMSVRVDKGIENAEKAGEKFGKQLQKKAEVESVVFDRSGYRYHGNVKAVAEGLRESGLKL